MQANYKAENQIEVPSGVISVNHSPFAIPVQKIAMVKSCYKIIPFGNCHVQILRREEVILTSSPVPWKRERAWRWGTYLALLLSEAQPTPAGKLWDSNTAPKPKQVLVV